MGFCYEDEIKNRKNEELNYNKKDINKIKNNTYENIKQKVSENNTLKNIKKNDIPIKNNKYWIIILKKSILNYI